MWRVLIAAQSWIMTWRPCASGVPDQLLPEFPTRRRHRPRGANAERQDVRIGIPAERAAGPMLPVRWEGPALIRREPFAVFFQGGFDPFSELARCITPSKTSWY